MSQGLRSESEDGEVGYTTIEVGAKDIAFANPSWEGYVEHTVATAVMSTLGVAHSVMRPRYELEKLVLVPPGSP